MGLLVNKPNKQSDMASTIVDVSLDLMEILQFGQIALAVGALVIIAREMLF